jgi:hypothetical protein
MTEDNSSQKLNKKPEKPKPKSVTKNKKSITWLWPIKIFFITLILSLVFSVSSEVILTGAGLTISIGIIVVLLVISVGFDMLGVAVAAASLQPFVAMSSKRVKGAKEAIKLVKNAEKVSSFSSDVIGDMCGILSGAVGASITIKIYAITNDFKAVIIASTVSSIIAALTVFGKAMGKRLAITKPEKIVFFASKIISITKLKEPKKLEKK